MKALEILKDIRNIETEYNHLKKHRFDQAIEELEALHNRSCDNCKHNKKQDNFMIFCDKEMCQDGSKMMWHSFTKDFCCNKWEGLK